ncbi:hypothetical protein F5888DRAFT_1634356 [Russula emetica]|nr:hypothetical protein F5888DRAFT_1634356 [Russula emetica]
MHEHSAHFMRTRWDLDEVATNSKYQQNLGDLAKGNVERREAGIAPQSSPAERPRDSDSPWFDSDLADPPALTCQLCGSNVAPFPMEAGLIPISDASPALGPWESGSCGLARLGYSLLRCDLSTNGFFYSTEVLLPSTSLDKLQAAGRCRVTYLGAVEDANGENLLETFEKYTNENHTITTSSASVSNIIDMSTRGTDDSDRLSQRTDDRGVHLHQELGFSVCRCASEYHNGPIDHTELYCDHGGDFFARTDSLKRHRDRHPYECLDVTLERAEEKRRETERAHGDFTRRVERSLTTGEEIGRPFAQIIKRMYPESSKKRTGSGWERD